MLCIYTYNDLDDDPISFWLAIGEYVWRLTELLNFRLGYPLLSTRKTQIRSYKSPSDIFGPGGWRGGVGIRSYFGELQENGRIIGVYTYQNRENVRVRVQTTGSLVRIKSRNWSANILNNSENKKCIFRDTEK